MNLRGKRVLVTGAASGIGQATAVLMAREGAKVFGVDVAAEGLARTGEIVRAAGADWRSALVDIGDYGQVVRLIDDALKEWNGIDVLANVAGVVSLHPMHEMPNEEWDRVIRVNLSGTFYLAKTVLPHMLRQKSGSIVNVASGKAMYGMANGSHYAASKGGVVAFTYSLAAEIEGSGVRVNAVIVPLTATPMSAGLRQGSHALPTAKNAAQPDDVADVILFLGSDRSRLLNGQIVGRVRPQ